MARSAVVEVGGAAGRMFLEQHERLTAAWRRERYAEQGAQGGPENLLDGVVEDFIRQVGHCLRGAQPCAWARTRGVLRLSAVRGEEGLLGELCTLRRCLLDALGVLDATPAERAAVERAVDEAAVSSLALLRRLQNPAAPLPPVPFGGLVVEVCEGPPRPRVTAHPERAATVH